MIKLIEFIFFRWKKEIHARGQDTWVRNIGGVNLTNSTYKRDFIEYKYTNKFDGSEKIKRKYIN